MCRSVLSFLLAAALLLSGCTAQQKKMPPKRKTEGTELAGQSSDLSGEESVHMDHTENVIYLAGGCFWGIEQLMQSIPGDRKSTRLNSSHVKRSRMPSSA